MVELESAESADALDSADLLESAGSIDSAGAGLTRRGTWRTPASVRARLGYDRDLLAAVSERLARAVLQDIRRSVKHEHGLASVAPLHGGVVTVVQRFRSDLGLYCHLHCLVTDGAFEERGEELSFLAAPPPTPEGTRTKLAAETMEADVEGSPASLSRCWGGKKP